VVKKSWFHHV
jgi:hypothetical protein